MLLVMPACSLMAQPMVGPKDRILHEPGVAEPQISQEHLGRLNAVIDRASRLPLPEALQVVLDSVRTIRSLTGISAAMILPGYGLWLGTSGYSNPLLGDTITSDMLFGIGSNTKTFIAATMLQLQEEGVLSLEDPLHKWLPTYQRNQYRYIDSNITIRQLLNHTSGIWDIDEPWVPFVDSLEANPDKFWMPESVLAAFVLPPNFAPGAGYSYSNTNYILAGMIIREATHSSVSSQVHQRFLGPLGLHDTFLAVEDSLAGVRACPWGNLNFTPAPRYDLSGLPITGQYSWIWTAGGMFSKPENMVRWISNLHGGRVLKDSSLAQMQAFSPQSGGYYGLGAYNVKVEGCVLLGHDGMYFGYDSEMMYCPEARVSVAVTTNCNYPAFVYPSLFSVYLHQSASRATDVALNRTYLAPGLDTLWMRAHVANPNGHPLVVEAYYRRAGVVVDSSQFFDDGLHKDSAASDGIWGSTWRMPPGEAYYAADICTHDMADSTHIVTECRFTTAGPLTLDSIGFTKSFGSSYRLKPYVRNNGSSLVVSGATVALRCGDPWVKLIGMTPVLLPDLAPGASAAPNTIIGLSYDSGAHPTFFNIKAAVAVDGWTYWTDSVKVVVTDVAQREMLPLMYSLDQNYPNPFNPSTTIRYALPVRSRVTLTVFNILGQKVKSIVEGEQERGYYEAVFDARNIASGVYIYRLHAGDFVQTKKLCVVR